MRRHTPLLPAGRGILLLPAAAIVVHQARYWLAYGSRADAELAAQGHSYLHSLVPWTIFALAAGAGLFLRRLADAARTGRAERPRTGSALGLWLASWLGLLVVYAAQESLEALLATGHPTGLGGVVGHGGFWAIPAAAVAAAGIVALLLVGHVLLVFAAGAARSRFRGVAQARTGPGVQSAAVRPPSRAAAGRSPPSVLLSR